ncbi:MAG: hypothetical protein GWN47_00400 [Woeseiaceae bacterium]|nr:hypothetical protein [Woeseiaceae bacterium]
MASKREIPLPRVLAEGTAIVVSILLAFSIDAWWDEQKERADEQEILLALKAEFEINRIEAKAVIDHHEESIRRVREFKSMPQDTLESMGTIEYRNLLRAFAGPRTFDPRRGTVSALISASKLGVLRDPVLREALMTFITIVEDADEDRYYMGETSLWVWREMLSLGGPWQAIPGSNSPDDCVDANFDRHCYIIEQTSYLPVVTADELLLIRANSKLMGLIDQDKIHAAHYASEVNEMLVQIERIIGRIDSSLNQH